MAPGGLPSLLRDCSHSRVEKDLGRVVVAGVDPEPVPGAEPAVEGPVQVSLGADDRISLVMPYHDRMAGEGQAPVANADLDLALRCGASVSCAPHPLRSAPGR